MMNMLWLLLFATAVALAWLIRRALRNWRERQRAEESRFASFMSKAAGTAEPTARFGLSPGRGRRPLERWVLMVRLLLWRHAAHAHAADGHARSLQHWDGW